MIFKDEKILLHERWGSHGAGQFASPGGHLEFGESCRLCQTRNDGRSRDKN